MPDEKRIKDFEPATEILNDDWFAVDSPSQGTRKMQASMFQAGLQSQITANRDDIDLQAGQIATLQLGVGNIGDKVDVLDSAVTTDAYSASSTYAVNDYCIYEDVMYKCITAIETPEAFTPSHWQATSIEGEINELNSSSIDNIRLGYFMGTIQRYGRLRIINLYNASELQPATSLQLTSKDYPTFNVSVSNWLLVTAEPQSYGSRTLSISTAGVLSTDNSVVRGGWTLIYIAKN